jgi:hypothetical protein
VKTNFDLNWRASPRPYLGEPGGESPPGHSTRAAELSDATRSSAIWGAPDVMQTRSRRQPLTRSRHGTASARCDAANSSVADGVRVKASPKPRAIWRLHTEAALWRVELDGFKTFQSERLW